MQTRREFLRTSALAAAAATARTASEAAPARLDRIGVGLFTIPTLLERDFAGAMKTLAAIGYKEVETFGPYPWSAQAAQDRSKVVAQSLAFKGSGRPIPANDAWIAALAVQHRLPVLSRDEHFDAVPGLRRRSW